MKIIFVDMDDTLCDFSTAFREHITKTPSIKFPQSQYGFFARLEPLHGAVEAVKAMIASKEYDPYILTAPSTRNPMSYTEKRVWVEEKFGYDFVERLIICSNKALLKGSLLIDDNETGKGQDQFEGELLHFGSERYPDWATLTRYLALDPDEP